MKVNVRNIRSEKVHASLEILIELFIN